MKHKLQMARGSDHKAAEALKEDEVLAILQPSLPRRIMALVILGALGALLCGAGLWRVEAPGLWRAVLLAWGCGAWLLMWCMWRATGRCLILTARGLFENTGRVVAWLDEIADIERGALAIKPAGGFTLRLRRQGPGATGPSASRGVRARVLVWAWAPGLWWRCGGRAGIGGVTRRQEGQYMAEVLSGMLEKMQKV